MSSAEEHGKMLRTIFEKEEYETTTSSVPPTNRKGRFFRDESTPSRKPGGALSLVHAHQTNFVNLKSRRPLRILLSLTFVLALFVLFTLRSVDENLLSFSSSAIRWAAPTGRGCEPNDFPCRISLGMDRWNQLQQRQSKTVEDAEDEYRARYGRDPPPGFDQWVKYALEHDSAVIDDYDQIEADLAPYRNVDPAVLRARMESAIKNNVEVTEARRLGLLEVKDGKLLATGYSYADMSNVTLYEILEDVTQYLPNFQVLYNWIPQPRVLGAADGDDDAEDDQNTKVEFVDRSNQDDWGLLRKACPASYTTKSDAAQDRPTIDICQLDVHDHDSHGMFVGPTVFIPTETLVPIMSRGKLSTNRDILVPNTCYWNKHYRLWNHVDETPFTEKTASFYWRGMTTGESLQDDNVYKSHRMRFINFLGWLRTAAEVYQQLTLDGKVDEELLEKYKHANEVRQKASIDMPEDVFKRLAMLDPNTYDAAFTRVFRSDSTEASQKALDDYRFTHHEKSKHMFEHQFLPDIDGESMSCRFYAQLAANSVPIKQTLFAEWHDDRIIPWAHYIPIAADLSDFSTVILWLQSKQGQQYAEAIAQNGRDWAAKTLRKEDITLYYYRLLLEYASIFSPTS